MKKAVYGVLFGFMSMLGVSMMIPSFAAAQQQDWAAGFNDQTSNKNIMINGSAYGVGGHDQGTGSGLLDSIRSFINWTLGLLGMVALVLCLYAGFKMVTSAGDTKKYEDGMAILKNAGIGLVIIGLSWMIVSVVMWLIGNLTGNSEETGNVTSGDGAAA